MELPVCYVSRSMSKETRDLYVSKYAPASCRTQLYPSYVIGSITTLSPTLS